MIPVTAATHADGLKCGRRAHIHRASPWNLCLGVLVAVCLAPCMARAQAVDAAAAVQPLDGQPARGTARWQITPRVTLSETYTDNMALAPPALAQSGWVRDITPSISVAGAGPRVSGSFAYSLHDLSYANQPQLNNRQNLLSSFATVEAVENWLFVDALASITQQNTSPFGPVAQDAASASSNRTETTIYRVSPYLRGRVSDIASYQFRFNQIGSHTNGGVSPATATAEWVAQIKNLPHSSKLGWSFDGDAMTIRNDTVGTKQNSRVRGSLIYDFQPELHASFMFGRENSDYASSTMQSTNTSGFGLEWSPGPRTQFAAVKERRSFGEGHSLLLSHRTAWVTLKYTDNKDVAVMSNQIAAGGQSSVQALMTSLSTSSIPDPVAGGLAATSGLAPTGASTAATPGFVTSSIFISRNRVASAVFAGRRNTITITLSDADSQSINPGVAPVTDSFSSSTDIRQRSASAAWLYRLSPVSTLTNSISSQRSNGSGAASAESRQYSNSAFLSSQIGRRTTASIGVRRTKFFSTLAPGYRENAFLGSLSISF